MRVLVVVLSLTICAAGCAKKIPESPQPTPVTTAPNPPQASEPAKPATAPPSTTTEKPAPQAATPPAPKETPAKPATPAPTTAAAAPATPAVPAKPAAPAPAKPTASPTPTKPAPATAEKKPTTPAPTKPVAPPRAAASNPTLDLTALKDQIKSTKAIGLMTKLTLKNQVDDLLDGFRDHYAGKGKSTMPQLRQSYDMLMMKVLSLLQDKDQKLASDIVASREVIWGLLADPKKFAALDV
ncbi:MAG TPA: hypothetical protein VFS23_11315 [Vicinamibacterales bacterium]|nr:hypothetical protein [Vicinamibacterales bacterium]